MIKSWRHKGLQAFYEHGERRKIPAKHSEKLAILLFQLANATRPEDMNTPGNGFHKLIGDLKGYYSIKVNANWRLLFQWHGKDAK
jgi:toxin HigB-1